ncbi:MAG: hypothetical protein HY858_05870 [Candidatus Solibacter usitatus]|nr:hypothetical protein [Candidatus Solibacter usitatus]
MATSAPHLHLTRPYPTARLGLLTQFAYLQALDLLTTLAFLLAGVKEGNPMVRAAISLSGSPIAGLVMVKVAALALGLFCWFKGRERLLSRANAFFALLVAWNLLCLILGLAARLKS